MRILLTTVMIIFSLVYGVDALPKSAANLPLGTEAKPIQSADNFIQLSQVIDNTPPILRNRDTAYVQLGSNDSVIVSPAQIDLGSTDDVGIDTMLVTPNTFTCSNIGFNPVVFTVRDTSGNSSSANVMVYVNSPFVLTDIVDTLEECAPVTIQWLGGCSGWNIDLSLVRISPFITQALVVEKIANSRTHQWQIPPKVPEGLYQFYVQESNKLNWGYGKPFYVKNTPPTVITKNIVLPLDAQGVAKITVGQIDNGSNDICGIDSMTVTPDSFGCSSVGVNTVTLSVTDLNGNKRIATATVTIVDTQVPLITAPANISIPTDNGSSTATNVVLGTPVTSDNCSIASVTNDAPTVFPYWSNSSDVDSEGYSWQYNDSTANSDGRR
ncbi:MAG: hypothetical protein IPM69_02870 [Ignavibacteria bacterium]|nr:hypothetical protein [Ignavibacteria bacterium]